MTMFTVSPAAERRIADLLAQEPGRVALRVAVQGGGCAGFSYAFSLAAAIETDDLSVGPSVIVDRVSADLLAGATLDYVDDLGGQYFRVDHPGATSRCGCGNSFSL